MTNCDTCQMDHLPNSYSYYGQAIGIFLLVLSVVGECCDIFFWFYDLLVNLTTCHVCPRHPWQHSDGVGDLEDEEVAQPLHNLPPQPGSEQPALLRHLHAGDAFSLIVAQLEISKEQINTAEHCAR